MTGHFLLDLYEEGERLDGDREGWSAKDDGLRLLLDRLGRSLHGLDSWRWELDKVLETYPKLGDQIRQAVEKVAPKCESPIEAAMAPWLIAQPYKYLKHAPMVLFPGEGSQLERGNVAVVSQLPVGRYRADFALAFVCMGQTRFYLIECDGRGFHDEERDAERDAEIKRNGRILGVIRLTGRDIMQSPAGCAVHVADEFARALWFAGWLK